MLHILQRAEALIMRTGMAFTYHSRRAKRAMAIDEDWPNFLSCS